MRRAFTSNTTVTGYYREMSARSPNSPHKPVIVQCFFKGADKCSVCKELLFGDYYKGSVKVQCDDAKKRRPICWCLQCFRLALPAFTSTYRATILKHRHCSFAHKHIDVENIVYHLVPQGRIRALSLKEKSMWAKFGEMKDPRGIPI